MRERSTPERDHQKPCDEGLLLNVGTLHGQKGSFREFCTLRVTLHPVAFFYTITPSKERHPSTPDILIKGLYEAFGKGDIDPIIDHLAGHFVWRFDAPPAIPFAGDYKTPRRSSPWVLWISSGDSNRPCPEPGVALPPSQTCFHQNRSSHYRKGALICVR